MFACLLLGSASDTDHAKKITAVLSEYGVESEIIVASAHKVPEKVSAHIERLNGRSDPTVVITVVGKSNGLAGVVAGGCVHPVLTCPPFKDDADYLVNVHSSLQMPSDVPVLTVLHPTNAALAALRILAESDKGLKEKLLARIAKVKSGY